jgi:KUP system potassium uptake protein
MIAVIVVVATFKDLAAMTNAYGYAPPSVNFIPRSDSNLSFSVATVMFTTTVLISIQAYYVKRWPMVAGIAIFIFFGFLDGRCPVS